MSRAGVGRDSGQEVGGAQLQVPGQVTLGESQLPQAASERSGGRQAVLLHSTWRTDRQTGGVTDRQILDDSSQPANTVERGCLVTTCPAHVRKFNYHNGCCLKSTHAFLVTPPQNEWESMGVCSTSGCRICWGRHKEEMIRFWWRPEKATWVDTS